MLALVLATALGAPPPAAETARLYFLAGDLARAVAWAQRGRHREPKACRPLLQALADYGFLAGHLDALTPAEARTLLELDRRISPAATGKLTQPVIERFVTRPTASARAWLEGGEVPRARALLRQVLEVDPSNADAKALLAANGGVGPEASDGGR